VDLEPSEQYVNCLYWAFTTMVTIGYGDISATNTTERVFVMIAMLVMAGVYAFTLSAIGKSVQSYNRLYDTFRENMLFLR
jgi:Ion channel